MIKTVTITSLATMALVGAAHAAPTPKEVDVLAQPKVAIEKVEHQKVAQSSNSSSNTSTNTSSNSSSNTSSNSSSNSSSNTSSNTSSNSSSNSSSNRSR